MRNTFCAKPWQNVSKGLKHFLKNGNSSVNRHMHLHESPNNMCTCKNHHITWDFNKHKLLVGILIWIRQNLQCWPIVSVTGNCMLENESCDLQEARVVDTLLTWLWYRRSSARLWMKKSEIHLSNTNVACNSLVNTQS